MSAAVQSCPQCPEDPCARLAREIDELINRDKRQAGGGGTHGLVHRFREQIEGANGPPGSGAGDPGSWETHDKAIKDQQKGLRDRLNDFNRNNCGSRVPVPQGAWDWATRPAPRPEEWKGPATAPNTTERTADPAFMRRMSELTGLTGMALLVYVIVSEGSRIFPPRNLVPIP